MPYGLRSGAPPEKPGENPGELSSMETQTESDGSDFETFVRKGILDIRSMLSSFEEALEFQSQRTTVLEQKILPIEEKLQKLDDKVVTFEQRLQRAEFAENKLERFSRRNNFRIIGLPQRQHENPMLLVRDFLKEYFGMDNPNIERAHRDGPELNNLPRHLLVKMLSFQDKKFIVSQQRKKLEKVKIYIVDDLTKIDRDEKRKWKKEVQEAFHAGTRYHFSAGKWRDGRGNLAAFYSTATAPVRPVGGSPSSDSHVTEDSGQRSSTDLHTKTTHRSKDGPPHLTRVVTAQVHAEDRA